MAREIGLQEMGLFHAIYRQRAIRQFKPDPVPDELVHKLIEAGTKAPSGGNRQPWKFLVIRDGELKRRIGEYYKRAYEAAYAIDSKPENLIGRLAGALMRLGNPTRAHEVLLAGLRVHPGHPVLEQQLGNVERRLRERGGDGGAGDAGASVPGL